MGYCVHYAEGSLPDVTGHLRPAGLDPARHGPWSGMGPVRLPRRSLVTAGIIAVLILAGGGTALAVTQGSPASGYKPATSSTTAQLETASKAETTGRRRTHLTTRST